jgi:hypothetical protein
MSVEGFRRKAEELILRAAETKNMKERGALIEEALHWHDKALAEMGKAEWPVADPANEASDEPTCPITAVDPEG